jgi:hypothetical protein
MNISHHIFRILTKKHGIIVSPEASDYLRMMFQNIDIAVDQILESLDFIAVEYVNQKGIFNQPRPRTASNQEGGAGDGGRWDLPKNSAQYFNAHNRYR